jgi:hypothetical protein
MVVYSRSIHRDMRRQPWFDGDARRRVATLLRSTLRFVACASIILSLAGMSSQTYGLGEASGELPAEAPTEVPAEEADFQLETLDAVAARPRWTRRAQESFSLSLAAAGTETQARGLASAALARHRSTATSKRGHMLPHGINAPLLI